MKFNSMDDVFDVWQSRIGTTLQWHFDGEELPTPTTIKGIKFRDDAVLNLRVLDVSCWDEEDGDEDFTIYSLDIACEYETCIGEQ